MCIQNNFIRIRTFGVPHETAVQIGAENGEIDINELRGKVTILDHAGDVNLTAINGDVHVISKDDDASIIGHSLSGAVALDGRSGDISLSDVSGPVTLHGDFFGTTHLERVDGTFHFQSSFTNLACAGVQGEINIEGRSDLSAHDLRGPVSLTTTDRDVSLSGIRDGATVRNQNGAVRLSLSDPLGPVDVSTTNASIEVHVPEKAAFRLTAGTSNGQIANDLGLRTEQQGDQVMLKGQVHSGGPALLLQTRQGNIHINKGDVLKGEDASSSDQDDADDDKKGMSNQHAASSDED